MGTYPKHYSHPAIVVAESIVKDAVQNRLIKNDWSWETDGFLLTKSELNEIRMRFLPGVSADTLEHFIGLVFSKVLPLAHHEFISDGYMLKVLSEDDESVGGVTIRELPPCFHGYVNRPVEYAAARNAVRALLEWRLINDDWRSYVGERKGGSDLIYGDLYKMIMKIGQFGYCRTRKVIEFVNKSVPELRQEWQAEGVRLVPIYHTRQAERECFTTLRLMPATPA